MEQYIYLSIIFFSLIILFLYIYIFYEKTLQAFKRRKKEKYSQKLIPFINNIILGIIKGKEIEPSVIVQVKQICKSKYKREIIEERMLYFFVNYKGNFYQKLIKFCEDIKIVEYEIKKLKSINIFKKALAAKRLGELRSKKAIKPLLRELNIANIDIKYNVLLALAKIGDESSFIKAFEKTNSIMVLSERSLIEIVDRFEGDKNTIYKKMINSENSFIASIFIKSAGNHKDISLSQDISKYLFSANKELRIAAVKAIGNIRDETYLDTMLKLLEDPEWEVRAVTARAIGNFTDSKILMPLAKALSDRQWYVRFNAATSILNHREGMKIVSYVFEGKDKFAKDIIISAIENSPHNILNKYETSTDVDEAALALKIKEYITMEQKE